MTYAIEDPVERDPEAPAVLGGAAVRPQGPPEWPITDPAVEEAVRRALTDGTWGRYHGPHGAALAERLAGDHDCEHAVLCCSGTAAVELALRGLKVGPGDEVLLAAYDFKGNFTDVLTVGATPVLVDVDRDNWNLDPGQLEAAMSPATKAIIVSHLHGGVVPMPPVRDVAETHGLAIIEDACQMPGALVDGRLAGTRGDVGILSFGGSKLLSAGRGGALLTDRAEIVQRIRLYTQRGNDAYPLSELQSAVLLPQLDRLDERNRRRAENVRFLRDLLNEQAGLTPFPEPTSPAQTTAGRTEPGYYKLGIRYDPAAFDGLPRDGFARAMRAEGIALDPGFRALHRIHSRRRYRSVGELAAASAADDSVLVLHHPVLLGTADELREIVAAVEKIRRHARGIISVDPGD